jgi:hypothetical protein
LIAKEEEGKVRLLSFHCFKFRALTIFVLLIVTSCAENTVTMGVIEFTQNDPVTIDLPETVDHAEDFQVIVRTYAGGCEREKSSTNVRISNLEALITPYNINTNDRDCTADLIFLDHVATLNFDQPGTATVTVRGRSRTQGGTIDVVRTVTVR